MALEYQRGAGDTRVSPLVITLLMVAGAAILGLAIAYLVVPFAPEAAWSGVMARMWF